MKIRFFPDQRPGTKGLSKNVSIFLQLLHGGIPAQPIIDTMHRHQGKISFLGERPACYHPAILAIPMSIYWANCGTSTGCPGLGHVDLRAAAGGRSTKLMTRRGDGHTQWQTSNPDFMTIRYKDYILAFARTVILTREMTINSSQSDQRNHYSMG